MQIRVHEDSSFFKYLRIYIKMPHYGAVLFFKLLCCLSVKYSVLKLCEIQKKNIKIKTKNFIQKNIPFSSDFSSYFAIFRSFTFSKYVHFPERLFEAYTSVQFRPDEKPIFHLCWIFRVRFPLYEGATEYKWGNSD